MTDTSTSLGEVPPEAHDDAATGRELLTVEEAARRLALGRTTVYALLKQGQITSVRIGRLRRIPVESLTAYTARLVAEQHIA
jgi:excisionase family DNA binding protein